MAFDNNLDTVTLPAAGDLSSSQFKLVTVDSNGRAAVANATQLVVGVLLNKPTALGQGATIAYGGVAKAYAGAAITAGSRVTADASGNAIAATLAGDPVLGVALTAATGAGEIIPVLLNPYPFATLA